MWYLQTKHPNFQFYDDNASRMSVSQTLGMFWHISLLMSLRMSVRIFLRILLSIHRLARIFPKRISFCICTLFGSKLVGTSLRISWCKSAYLRAYICAYVYSLV